MNVTTVRVTQRHIDQGKPGDPCSCAVALALGDTLRAEGADFTVAEVTDAYLGDWEAVVEQRDTAGVRRFHAWLDEEAVEFVEAFDARQPVQPDEFTFTWAEVEPIGDDE